MGSKESKVRQVDTKFYITVYKVMHLKPGFMLTLGDNSITTSFGSGTDPEFKERFCFDEVYEDQNLIIQVWDGGICLRNELLGEYEVPITPFHGKERHLIFKLFNKKVENPGQIELGLYLCPPGINIEGKETYLSYVSGGVINPPKPTKLPINPNAPPPPYYAKIEYPPVSSVINDYQKFIILLNQKHNDALIDEGVAEMQLMQFVQIKMVERNRLLHERAKYGFRPNKHDILAENLSSSSPSSDSSSSSSSPSSSNPSSSTSTSDTSSSSDTSSASDTDSETSSSSTQPSSQPPSSSSESSYASDKEKEINEKVAKLDEQIEEVKKQIDKALIAYSSLASLKGFNLNETPEQAEKLNNEIVKKETANYERRKKWMEEQQAKEEERRNRERLNAQVQMVKEAHELGLDKYTTDKEKEREEMKEKKNSKENGFFKKRRNGREVVTVEEGREDNESVTRRPHTGSSSCDSNTSLLDRRNNEENIKQTYTLLPSSSSSPSPSPDEAEHSRKGSSIYSTSLVVPSYGS